MKGYVGPYMHYAGRTGYAEVPRSVLVTQLRVIRMMDRAKAIEYRNWLIWLGVYPVRLRKIK